jgi:hypothetical protein
MENDGFEHLGAGRVSALRRIADELERCTPADALQVASTLSRAMTDPTLTEHARRVLFAMLTCAGVEAGAQRHALQQIEDELGGLA